MPSQSSSLGSPRRYYLAKRHAAKAQNSDLTDSWKYKQLQEPGTALPDDFPCVTDLEVKGYVAVEDLTGASEKELKQQGFSKAEAETILAALSAL